MKALLIVTFLAFVNNIRAQYQGPYLFWGIPKLSSVESSALNGVDDEFLKDLFSEASAIIIFIKNSTHKFNSANYPSLENIMSKREWAYMPQNVLLYDPFDFNQKTEIINLSGSDSQEDVELSALFHDAEVNFGEKKVLGILANTETAIHGFRRRREAPTETTSISPTDEPISEDYIYYSAGKALLYSTEAPIVRIFEGNSTDDPSIIELKKHGSVFVDERDQWVRLIIMFVTPENNKIYLRFRFPISSGYWSMALVEFEDNSKNIVANLSVVGAAPSAPVTFSWKCSKSLVFRNNNISLTLQNVQVQPTLNGASKFSDAYDCVGFVTAPIWSGIFVSAILLLVLSVGITAILDIKPPNRFENSRSKQLTFTVQE